MFFIVLRKVQVFGIGPTRGSFPGQVNYFIDEAVSCGKGANVAIT